MRILSLSKRSWGIAVPLTLLLVVLVLIGAEGPSHAQALGTLATLRDFAQTFWNQYGVIGFLVALLGVGLIVAGPFTRLWISAIGVFLIVTVYFGPALVTEILSGMPSVTVP